MISRKKMDAIIAGDFHFSSRLPFLRDNGDLVRLRRLRRFPEKKRVSAQMAGNEEWRPFSASERAKTCH